MKPKPGYKLVKSLFGKYEEIPKDWDIKKFNELFEFLKTGSNPRFDLGEKGDIQYIHYGDIHAKWNSILDCDLEKIPWIDKSKVKGLPLLKDGDLVLVDASEDHEGSGTSIVLKNVKNKKIVSGLHTIALRSNDKNISSNFKTYLISIKYVKNQIIGYVTGVSVYGLSKRNLKNVRIPLPTLPEQKRIASILSNVDSLISSYDNVIQKKEVIKHGVSQQLLTRGIDHTKFKKIKRMLGKDIEIPLKWEIKNLDEISDVIDPWPSHRAPQEKESGIPYLGIGDFDEDGNIIGISRYVDNSVVKKQKEIFNLSMGDLAIGRVASIGKIVKLNPSFNFAISPTLSIIKPKISSSYLVQTLKSNYFQEELRYNIKGSTRSSVGIQLIRKLKILMPSNDEQEKIASILSNIDAEIKEFKMINNKLKILKKGLIQKLLTGQIQVKV